MQNTSDQFHQFTQVQPTGPLGRLVQFPLSRILISFLFIVPVSFLHLVFDKHVRSGLGEPTRYLVLNAEVVVGFTLFLLSYVLYTRLVERRRAYEVSLKGAVVEAAYGLLIGGVLLSSAVVVLSALGCYRLAVFNPDYFIAIRTFLPIMMAAFVEELLFRVILFRLTEELAGSWVAIAVQAVLFGFAHAGNPGATLWSSIAIVIEAGILLAAAFMLTRRVWLALGIHAAWNYTQSTIFGISTSGDPANGLIIPLISGPAWLTGGEFGIEASVPAVLLCLIGGLIVLHLAVKKGRVIAPSWSRKHVTLPPNQ